MQTKIPTTAIPDPELDTYRVTINDATLYVPRLTLRAAIPRGRRLHQYTNHRILAYTHQANLGQFRKEIAVGETLPQKVLVMFQDEDAYNGSYTQNKLKFTHEKASNVLVKCNQKHLPQINGYSSNWSKNRYHQVFQGLITELQATHNLQYTELDAGLCIHGIDMTANKTGNITQKAVKGTCELSVDFRSAPTKNIIVLVMLVYAGKFVITENGQFYPDGVQSIA